MPDTLAPPSKNWQPQPERVADLEEHYKAGLSFQADRARLIRTRSRLLGGLLATTRTIVVAESVAIAWLVPSQRLVPMNTGSICRQMISLNHRINKSRSKNPMMKAETTTIRPSTNTEATFQGSPQATVDTYCQIECQTASKPPAGLVELVPVNNWPASVESALNMPET
jgi:hypothetical protein